MFYLFGEAKKFFKHLEKVKTDNAIFRLHYKATVLLHIAFMCLLGAKQYFGDPIICNRNGDDKVMDVFCWIHGTWTIEELFQDVYASKVAHPGVGFYEHGFTRVNHSYYQWIPVVLLLSATCFYIPRFIWKSQERGRMALITEKMGNPVSLEEENGDGGEKALKARVGKLIKCIEFRSNYSYAQRFVFCEVLNLINLFWQWYFFNTFLDGHFLTYGSDYLSYYFETGIMQGPLRYNPMNKVFPKIAKCDYRQVAGEGGIQKKDALCTLPLNIINDRVFLILWFWFVALTIITFLGVIFRVLCVISRSVRRFTLLHTTSARNGRAVDSIVHNLRYHVWFIIYQIGKNVDPETFDEFVSVLPEEIQSSERRLEREGHKYPRSETTSIESEPHVVFNGKRDLQEDIPPFTPPSPVKSSHSYPTLRKEEGLPLSILPSPTQRRATPSNSSFRGKPRPHDDKNLIVI